MAWSRGSGAVASIDIGATNILGGLIEGYSLSTEPDTFDNAIGFTSERGSVTKRVMFNCADYSKVSALNTLMVNKTPSTVTINYLDGVTTQDIASCIIRVKPTTNLVPDVSRVYALEEPVANNNSLASTFDDLGPIIGGITVSYDYPFDGSTGDNKPYFVNGRVDGEFVLVGDGTVTNPMTVLAALATNPVRLAFQNPAGNFLVFKNVYIYYHYADEDSTNPRAVRVRFSAVVDAWTDLIEYTNGDVSALTDPWGTETNGVDPGNFFTGCEVEATSFHYSEASLVSFP